MSQDPPGWRSATPEQMTVVDSFERTATLYPDRIALQSGAQTLTFSELDRRAGLMAQRLRARSVTRDGVVALVLERSFEQVIASLATMKAGGGFIPIDPHWPLERLRSLVEDSGAPVVITAGALDLDWLGDRRLDMDDEAETDGLCEAPPLPRPAGEDLAYVIYTSGSTGRPKGVEITHASLMNFVRWRWRLLAVSPEDRTSHLASPAFDGSICEVWPQLTAGACVCIAPDAVKVPARRLMDWMVGERITLATVVPPVLAESMIRARWPAETRLRIMQSAGEALHAYPAPDLPFMVLNGYGPTENTVETTNAVVKPNAAPKHPPPIGRAVDGVELHILDEDLRPMPAGATGELYIGGPNLARGYRGRPELTAERFVHSPHVGGGGARLYRTGDLVRRLPDGQLAFHGRCDDQVKVLGHRVELGEIAAVLAQHPDVASAAVLPDGDSKSGRLAGYATARAGASPSGEALRRFLAERLPTYMVPIRIELLDALPLTTNGKVDRRALAARLAGPSRARPGPPAAERVARPTGLGWFRRTHRQDSSDPRGGRP